MTKNEERLSKLFKELVRTWARQKPRRRTGQSHQPNRIPILQRRRHGEHCLRQGNPQPAGPIPDCKRQPRNQT